MNLLLDPPEHSCPFCLQPSAAHLRFDKHNRPYLVCVACHTRAFFKTRSALLGLVALPDFIAGLNERARDDPSITEELHQRFAVFLQGLQRRAEAQPEARESGEMAVPVAPAAAGEKVA